MHDFFIRAARTFLVQVLDLADDPLDLFLHGGVPVILDCIVCATFQVLGDIRPLVFALIVLDKQDKFLVVVPVHLLDERVEVVVPAFATLLPDAAVEVLGNCGPLLRLVLIHELEEKQVFFFAPRALDQVRIQHLLPPVQTLNIGTLVQLLCDLLPIFASELFDGLLELAILFFAPVTFLAISSLVFFVLFLILGWPGRVDFGVVHVLDNDPFLQVLLESLVVFPEPPAGSLTWGWRQSISHQGAS